MSYRTEPDEITNSQDIIDSRDIVARIEWLEEKETAIADAKELEQDYTSIEFGGVTYLARG